MKKYIVTEKDIERLRHDFECNSDNDWWYISQLDNWEKTLSYKTDDPYEDLQREIDSLKKKLNERNIIQTLQKSTLI